MAESNVFVSPIMKCYIAVAVGVPVVVGVGYWYLNKKNRCSRDSAENDKDLRNRDVLGPDISNKKVNEKHKQMTPLEEAMHLKERGNKYFKNGKFQEAIKNYEKAIELCPKCEVNNLATFYQNKAAAYEQLKNYEEVQKASNEALSLNPRYIKALLRRSKAYEQMNELKLAFEDLTAVCMLENFESYSTLIAADILLNKLAHQNTQQAMENQIPTMPSSYSITSYFSTFINDPIQPFLDQTDGDFSKGFLKSVDCVRRKDYDNVIFPCTEEIDSEAKYKNEALVLRGTFYHLSGRYALAIEDFNAVINNEENNAKLRVNALIKLSCIYMHLEDSTKCFDNFQKAIQIDPNNCDIYHHRGLTNLMTEKFQEAADDFDTAVKLNTTCSVTAAQKCYTDYRSGMLLKDEEKIQSALKRFEQLLTEYPDSAECYSLYAEVLSTRQEYEEADKLYEKAIKIDSNNATFLLCRANLNVKWTGDTSTAIEIINEALKIDDKNALAYEHLGSLEVHRGNLDKGIELFEKAINLAKSQLEMSRFFMLKNVAEAQKKVIAKLNLQLPGDFMDQ